MYPCENSGRLASFTAEEKTRLEAIMLKEVPSV